MMGLPPGTTTTSSGVDRDAARAAHIVGDGFAQLRQPRRGAVVRPAAAQRIHRCFHNVRRSRRSPARRSPDERCSSPLALQRLSLAQNFKCRLRAQPRHAPRQKQFVLHYLRCHCVCAPIPCPVRRRSMPAQKLAGSQAGWDYTPGSKSQNVMAVSLHNAGIVAICTAKLVFPDTQ